MSYLISEDASPTIPMLTISYKESSRLQELAAVPDAIVQDEIEIAKTNARKIAILRILKRAAKEREAEALRRKREQEAADKQAQRARYTPQLIHADVLIGLREIETGSIDLIATDPPYNMGKAAWDELGDYETYAAWCKSWLTECQRVLKSSGSIYVFGRWDMLRYVSITMDEIELMARDFITWDTIQGTGGGLYVNRQEHILFYTKHQNYYRNPDAIQVERHEKNIREYKGQEYRFKNVSNIWRFPCVDEQDADRVDHPTQKPVALMERIIRASSPHGGMVLDCFIGSGTTGVAAMQLERTCIGIDQDRRYLDIAERRFTLAEIGAGL